MLRWEAEHRLVVTEGVDGLDQKKLFAVPIEYSKFPHTNAVCLTGKTQLGWIRQLVESSVRYVLHIDGKHKLHHGKWMLVTIGVHDLRLADAGKDRGKYAKHRRECSHSLDTAIPFMICVIHGRY